MRRALTGIVLMSLLGLLLSAGGVTSTAAASPTPDRVAASRTLTFTGQTPQLRGPGHVGTRLRVTLISKRDFQPDAQTLSYRWLRRGEVIPSAREKSYRLTEEDRPRRIKAIVIAKRQGWKPRRVRTNVVKVAR